MCNLLPQGTTAPIIIDVSMARQGPRMNKNLEEKFGMISSLKNNFNPSANGCSIPKGPARFGPLLSCKMAATFLSANVEYMAITSDPLTTATIKISFSVKTDQSINNIVGYCILNNYGFSPRSTVNGPQQVLITVCIWICGICTLFICACSLFHISYIMTS